MTTTNTAGALMRLSSVLQMFPVSRATWYEGVRTGRYPSPVRLGARAVAWRRSDIERLIAGAPDAR
jgi:prophage regulatory protein